MQCACASFIWASAWQRENVRSLDEAQKFQEKQLHPSFAGEIASHKLQINQVDRNCEYMFANQPSL